MSQTPIFLKASDLDGNGDTYCPNPKAQMQVWNTHPKVYLAFSKGDTKCPYCGTEYALAAGEVVHSGH